MFTQEDIFYSVLRECYIVCTDGRKFDGLLFFFELHNTSETLTTHAHSSL
jgi:hypothetical protein